MWQHFVAHMRSRSGVLAKRANRVGQRGNRRTEDRKMADQVEDLGIPMRPARPMAGTTVPPRAVDLSRPGGEPAHTITSPRQSLGTRDNEVEARTLIIGREISLSGEINSCDRLIVEGRIEANLQNCKHITVAETGIFKGKAAIDDA